MENNDWEKEFDDKFAGKDWYWNPDVVYDFIREIRLSAFQEGLEESLRILNEIKELSRKHASNCPAHIGGMCECASVAWYQYNSL